MKIMLIKGSIICIEKNFLQYEQNKKMYRSIPEGIYEVKDLEKESKRNTGPFYELSIIGGKKDPLIVDWKSLQYNTKWRIL